MRAPKSRHAFFSHIGAINVIALIVTKPHSRTTHCCCVTVRAAFNTRKYLAAMSIFIGAESAAGVAVTVLMLKVDDLRTTDAFDAAQVLREAKE
jgi:hypothetical protein